MAENLKPIRWSLVFFAGIAAVCAAYLIARKQFGANSEQTHRFARQVILHYTLSRVDDPIIVLGDSITEASTLPRSLCGRPIVNAGLDGASTASELGDWLTAALSEKRAYAIIVALGTNDALALARGGKPRFEERYASLLGELSQRTTRLFVLDIPAVEVRARLTEDLRKEIMPAIQQLRAMLPELAKRNGATFLSLPEMPAPFTIDGIHLNADGYSIWDASVMRGAALACEKS
jgi:hypothetical protein